MGWPVVIAANGRGIPVTESPNGTPYEIATNGYGTPVVFVDQGGLPVSSVLPVWAAGASQAWDFTAGRYYNSAAVPTDTHGQTINADDLAGAYSAFAPNVLVRTSRGLQTSPTRTELLLRSASPYTYGALIEGATKAADATVYQGVFGDAAVISSGTTLNAGVGFGGSVSLTAAVSYYVWVLYKSGTSPTASINIFASPSWTRVAGAPGSLAVIAAPTGTVSNIENVSLGGGVYLCGFTYVPNATGNNTLAVGTGTTSASNVTVIAASMQAGSFRTPPIITTGAAATVAGNQQVISGLGTQLAGGVYGFVQVVPRGFASANKIFTISDGTLNNRIHLEFTTGLRMQQVISGAVQSGSGLTGTLTSGSPSTIAFAFGPGFQAIQQVGSIQRLLADGYPVVDRVTFGGDGFSTSNNTFQNTRLLALWYGQPDAAKFDAVYAKAVQAHALAA